MTETSRLASVRFKQRIARACGLVVLGASIVCQSPAFAQSHPVLAVRAERPVAATAVTNDVVRLQPAAPRVQGSQAASVRPGMSEPRALLILAIGFFGMGALASRRKAESQ